MLIEVVHLPSLPVTLRSNPVNPHVVTINSTSSLDPSTDLVVILHGFTGSASSKSVTLIRDALLFKQNITVVAVQWATLARGPWYDEAAANTVIVAQQLHHFLSRLEEGGFDLERVHIIGFSLGAHVAGATGALLGGRLGRITGLDPARPGFENQNSTGRLDATDAIFVMGMHTAGGFLSLTEPVGHADFYPNGGSKQPHCQTDNVPFICNHFMAYKYFAESIYNPEAFPAHSCSSWTAFDSGHCDANDVVFMGYHTPNIAKGLYFLRTNAQEPFGQLELNIGQSDLSSANAPTDPSILQSDVKLSSGSGHQKEIYSVDSLNKTGEVDEVSLNDLDAFPSLHSSSCGYKAKPLYIILFVSLNLYFLCRI